MKEAKITKQVEPVAFSYLGFLIFSKFNGLSRIYFTTVMFTFSRVMLRELLNSAPFFA